MKHRLLLLYTWFIRTLFFFIPDMPLTMRVRGFFYGLGMKKCGRNFQVTNDAWLKGLENINVGDNVFVGNSTMFIGGGNTFVGNNVLIGPHVIIVTGNHVLKSEGFNNTSSNVGAVVINDGSWVGANCTLATNATLSRNSILAANSFLSRKLSDEGCLYGGVPAKFIKRIIC